MTKNLLLVTLVLSVACGGNASSKPSGDQGGGAAPQPDKPATVVAAKPPGDGHSVFNLVDNRLLAHIQRQGGIVALAGSAGFDKYLNFGKPNTPWKLGQTVDGHRVAVAERYARASLPLAADQAAKADRLFLRARAATAVDVEVKLNGKSAGSATVPASWATVEVKLPAGAAKAGENELELVFAKKDAEPAVEWIQLGGSSAGDAAPVFWDKDKRALVLPQGGGLAWYVLVPRDGRLSATVDGAGCEVGVRAAAHEGAPVESTLKGSAEIDLQPLAGKVVRLDLTGRGCPEARLVAAALTLPGPEPKVERTKRPKHVVFWILDGLRADKVRPFFPGARPEVPNWEELAKSATLFDSTYVQGNESRASHAAMWTSLYTGVHRMIKEKDVLDSKWDTIGEVVQKAGWQTVGVSSNGYVAKRWGFGDGWDVYRNHIHEELGTTGEAVWETAEKETKGRWDKPMLLYLGFVDTHVSWRAHEPWISKYDTESGAFNKKLTKAAFDPDVEDIATGKWKITDRDKSRIKALYDSDVSYEDGLIGKVRKRLVELGAADDTMLIITADHGEEMWEDGRLGHGGSQRDMLVHVPLAIYYPPLFPAGMVTEGAETIDILPTILDAIGAPPLAQAQGESLIPIAQGVGRGYPRPAMSSQYEDAHTMLLGGWKITVRSNGVARLYDMAADHSEEHDLAESRPLERRFVTDAFSTLLVRQKEWKKRLWGVASNQSATYADDAGN